MLSKRIVLAPDAFKGCLSADMVADAMRKGIQRVLSGVEIVPLPMADGGEGSLDILLKACGGQRQSVVLPGVEGSPRGVDWGVVRLNSGKIQAVIEAARIIGMSSVNDSPVEERSSEGLGMLIRHCLDQGIRHFLIGLGGSATNDGGAGLLAALGVKLSNKAGNSVSPNLDGLADLAQIDPARLDHRLSSCSIQLICDVDNPLCGAEGATLVYGPQKGVPQAKVAVYDARLRNFASLCEACFGFCASDRPGAGAAGGLGFALQLSGASYHPGATMIADMLGLDAVLKGSDLVFTGEGRTDSQTLHGKVVFEVARRAKRQGVPVALVAGTVDTEDAEWGQMFAHIREARPDSMSLAKSMQHAPDLIAAAAEWITAQHFQG